MVKKMPSTEHFDSKGFVRYVYARSGKAYKTAIENPNSFNEFMKTLGLKVEWNKAKEEKIIFNYYKTQKIDLLTQ